MFIASKLIIDVTPEDTTKETDEGLDFSGRRKKDPFIKKGEVKTMQRDYLKRIEALDQLTKNEEYPVRIDKKKETIGFIFKKSDLLKLLAYNPEGDQIVITFGIDKKEERQTLILINYADFVKYKTAGDEEYQNLDRGNQCCQINDTECLNNFGI